MKKLFSGKFVLILVAVFVILLLCCFFGRHLLTERPFSRTRLLDGPSGVFSGPSGRTYVIDVGQKSVLVINADGKFVRSIDSESGGFYYASLVAEGADGSIYISDTRYSMKGTLIERECIFKYDKNGTNPRVIYEIKYSDDGDQPRQYGRIKSLREIDGLLVFTVLTPAGAEVNTLDPVTGALGQESYALGGAYISDLDVMPTRTPVFATRLGEIIAVSVVSGVFDVLVDADEGFAPWRIAVEGDYVYFADLNSSSIVRLDVRTGEKTNVLQGEYTLYTVFAEDGRLYSTDYMGYYVTDGDSETYTDSLPLAGAFIRTLLWAALFLVGLSALAAVLVLALPFIKRKKSQTFQRLAIVLVVSLCVGALVTFISLDQTIAQQSDSIMENLSLFGDMLIGATDSLRLENISDISDYMGEDYVKVKDALDKLTQMSYDNGLYYYYGLYKTDGEMIYGVMDFENTITARHPMYPFGTEGYTEAFFGETVSVSFELSSYGFWSFMLKPVFGDSGDISAVLEVGVNLDNLNAQKSALVRQIILTVSAVTVVLLMLIIEAVFLFEHFEKRRVSPELLSVRFPLRSLIFITYLADCMQDAFVSIYANQLYVPFWGIPRSVGAALPLSAQVLTAALFALVGGNIVYTAGAKKTLVSGFTLQIIGFAVCAALGSYGGLVLGKVLIGAGMGLIVVSVNSISAAGGDDGTRAGTFAAISAGTLAGVTAGSGVGSVILSLGTFKIVYIAGAVILLPGLFLTLTCAGGGMPEALEKKEKEGGMLSFIADRQVAAFLLFMLAPFLIAISFRDYFFPIYAVENGISEANIGRIYLACGIAIIYAGPRLTKLMLKKLGGKWAVATASALLCVATLLFALIPTLTTAIVGLVLLAVAVSFGYAMQGTYYSSLPRVAEYGESRAMGIYSLFDNIGQTLGPVLYGLAVMGGSGAGLLIIGGLMAFLIVAFIVTNGKKRN